MAPRPNLTLKLHTLPPSVLEKKFKTVIRDSNAVRKANTPKPVKGKKKGGRAKKPVAVPKTISYKKASAPSKKVTTEEKIGRAAVGSFIGKKAGQAVLKLGGKNVGAVARVAGRVGSRGAATAVARLASTALSAVALAGIAAFAITTVILNRRAATKKQLQDNAFNLGQAYRRARLVAEEKQGRKLTPLQHQQLRDAFRAEAEKLGILTPEGWNLSKLK